MQFGEGGVRKVRDGNGRSALHFAAQVGQNELCTALLAAHGITVDAQDDHGEAKALNTPTACTRA